jgi:hypothetical protein
VAGLRRSECARALLLREFRHRTCNDLQAAQVGEGLRPVALVAEAEAHALPGRGAGIADSLKAPRHLKIRCAPRGGVLGCAGDPRGAHPRGTAGVHPVRLAGAYPPGATHEVSVMIGWCGP